MGTDNSSASKVFDSNALRTVLLDCLPAFDRATGVATTVDFGSTNHTLDIARGGAVADLIIAAASAIDARACESKIIKGTRTGLAVKGVV